MLRSGNERDLFEPVADLLKSREMRERGIYDINTISADLDRHRRGDIDAADRLFDVAQFELWSRLSRQ